jgi:predicted GNAT family acetyltransferase
VTALLARRLLEMGTREVLIFTDSDDPVPGRVYSRVGFAELASFAHWEFVWPGSPSSRAL